MSEVPAIVAYAPQDGQHDPNWRFENIKVARELKENELLIKMVATGVCHTDVHYSSMTPVPEGTKGVRYPWIMGHEGVGYATAIGEAVTVASIGDPVVLSFDSCGICELCITGRPSYCVEGEMRTVLGAESDVFKSPDGISIRGKFFGQSSFSSMSIVNQASVVNLKGLVENEDELRLFAPMGCGLQTGAGAVIHSGYTRATDIVVVSGLGGVGLGAVMGAKLAGLKAIIAVDRVQSRLEIAKALGATHLLNTSGDNSSFVENIDNLINHERISLAIETTGVPPVMIGALTCLGSKGKYIQIAPPPPDFSLPIPPLDLFRKSKIIEGSIQGSAVSRDFIPKMIQWYREGKFPVEKFVTFFAARDVGQALKGMKEGVIIKPVLVW